MNEIIKNELVRNSVNQSIEMIHEGRDWAAIVALRQALDDQLREIYTLNGWRVPRNGTPHSMLSDSRMYDYLGIELTSKLYKAKNLGNNGAHKLIGDNESANICLNTTLELIGKVQGIRFKKANVRLNRAIDNLKTDTEKKISSLQEEIEMAKAKKAEAEKRAKEAEEQRLKAEADAKKASTTSKAKSIVFDIMMTNF